MMFTTLKKYSFLFLLFIGWQVAAQPPLSMVEASGVEKLITQYPDSAYVLLKVFVAKARSSENAIEEARCLEKMGEVLYHMGNYKYAVEHLLAAENIARKASQPELLAHTLNSLGTVCYYNHQASEASNYFAEALNIYSSLRKNAGLAETYSRIGQMYEKRSLPDSAYHFQRLALRHALAAADSAALAKVYENIGSILEDRQRYDSALAYYKQSLQLNERLGNRMAQIEVVNNVGDIYRKTNRVSKSLDFTRQAMQMAVQLQEKYQLNSACRDMAKAYQLLGIYDSAYQYLEQSRALMQEIYAADNSKQIALMQAFFDTERKNAEITKLGGERNLNITIAIAALAVLLLLSGLYFLNTSRQKLKLKNEQVKHQHQQEIYNTQRDLMEAELRNKQLEESSLKQQLELKGKELSSHILHLIQKNEVMDELKTGLTDIIKDDKRDQKKKLRLLLQKISFSFSQDDYWEEFRLIFDQVHQSFFATLQLQCPSLSATEMRLLSLVKMNLGSADMATLLGITPDSLRVTRYRVKKKLNLGAEESLTSFIQGL